MPLSKARDRERKRKERARIRLDKLLSALGERKTVQPKWSVCPDEGVKFRSIMAQEIDADGNEIPEM